ncbi:hypothetical protein HY636_01520 [Candidatus Woesearchaeota archaeon]|nr:hypothetical protein [Candidatus Woesearchaeota archaeon]
MTLYSLIHNVRNSVRNNLKRLATSVDFNICINSVKVHEHKQGILHSIINACDYIPKACNYIPERMMITAGLALACCSSPIISYSKRDQTQLTDLLQQIDANLPIITQDANLATGLSNYQRLQNYELSEYKPIQFTLPNGTLEDGIYKQGESTAPLIIGSFGFFSDVHANAVYNFTHIVREEVLQDYNVLILNHPSSAPFYCANGEASWGGIEEGYIIIEIAKQMKEQFGISHVHAIGVSMGGNGVMHAAYRGKRVLDSAIAFSSVTDFLDVPGNTLRSLRNDSEFGPTFWSITGWLNSIGMKMLYDGFEEERKKNPACKGKPFTLEEIETIYLTTPHYANAERMKEYLAPYIADKILPEKMPSSLEEYLSMSDTTHIASSIQIPLLVVHAHDDAVVSEHHYYRFMLAGRENPFINGIMTTDGGHWGFSAAYGTKFVACLIRTYTEYWSMPKLKPESKCF